MKYNIGRGIVVSILLKYLFVLLVMVYSEFSYGATLNINDRIFLGRSIAEGNQRIGLLVAVKNNGDRLFLNYLEKEGGRVVFSAPEVGYYRIDVSIGKALSVVNHPTVSAVGIHDGSYLLNQSGLLKASSSEKSKINVEKYLETASSLDSLFNFSDMKLDKVLEINPNYDGRGSTIAILEGHVQADAAELQMAKLLDGTPTRKIVGIRPIYDAEFFKSYKVSTEYNIWPIYFSSPRISGDGFLWIGGHRIKMPSAGQFRVGILDEAEHRRFNRDLNGDGNPNGKPDKIVVVRDVKNGCVYIDTNIDKNLEDEECLRDFNVDFKSYRFKKRDGSPYVWFSINDTEHPDIILLGTANTHSHQVAARASGTQFLGTNLSGVAPAARLLIVPIGYAPYSLLEGQIVAARDPRVDVIAIGHSSLNNYTTPLGLYSIIQKRIETRLNKIIISAAGNDGTLGRVTDQGHSENVLSVGQYFGPTIIKLAFGVEARATTTVHSTGGPAPDGLLKPDVLAPSFSLSPGVEYDHDYVGSVSESWGCPNLENLPRRLHCFGGTSGAYPTLAGAAAVLISAARQEKLKVGAREIRLALIRTAGHIDGEPAFRQGNGVIDLVAALDWLRKHQREAPVEVSVEAPVRTILSDELTPAGVGRGIYEREGWSVGDVGVREVVLTRRTGERERRRYRLVLLGDDAGTFVVPSSITLPINKPVRVPVRISPRTTGVHSASLAVYANDGGELITKIGMTVVAAPIVDRNLNYVLNQVVKFDRSENDIIYFRVPENSAALNIYIPKGRASFIAANGPLGSNIGGQDRVKYGQERQLGRFEPSQYRTIFRPSPGLWEVKVEPWDQSAAGHLEVEIRVVPASPLSSSLETPLWATPVRSGARGVVEGAVKGGERSPYSISNNSFSRLVVGSYKSATMVLDELQGPIILPLSVPKGAVRIDAYAQVLDSDTLSKRPVAVALLECGNGPCQARSAQGGNGQAGVVVGDPSTGSWKFLIEAPRMPGKAITVKYEVFVTSSAHSIKAGSMNCVEMRNILEEASVKNMKVFTELADENFRAGSNIWAHPLGVESGRFYYDIFVLQEDSTLIPLMRRPLDEHEELPSVCGQAVQALVR